MLTIAVTLYELFDEATSTFLDGEQMTLELEHSLASLSKWESIHEKPFMTRDDKTPEEILSYIKVMTRTPDVPPEVFLKLSQKNIEEINGYINSKQTATWFREMPSQQINREIVTAEIIYYWMASLNVPIEFEHWHLSRLLTLIKVINEKNNPQKSKMSKRDMLAERKMLNTQRRQQMGTRG